MQLPELVEVLTDVGLLEAYAEAAALAAVTQPLPELRTLALTNAGALRQWLTAELGVRKLGHREKILNALRRAPQQLALVPISGGTQASGSSSPEASGSSTGVFIGDPLQPRPLPELSEAGMYSHGWSIAEVPYASRGGSSSTSLQDCTYLLCAHPSGMQLVLSHGGGSFWVRNQRSGGFAAAGAWVAMDSGATHRDALPCAGSFGRLGTGVRRPLGDGSFHSRDGRQIVTHLAGVLGISPAPYAAYFTLNDRFFATFSLKKG